MKEEQDIIATPVRYDDGRGLFFDANGRWLTFGAGEGEHIAKCINEYAELKERVAELEEKLRVAHVGATNLRLEIERENK